MPAVNVIPARRRLGMPVTTVSSVRFTRVTRGPRGEGNVKGVLDALARTRPNAEEVATGAPRRMRPCRTTSVIALDLLSESEHELLDVTLLPVQLLGQHIVL